MYFFWKKQKQVQIAIETECYLQRILLIED